MAFVCRRTVRMAAIYQLKIKYDQDRSGEVRSVFLKTQNATRAGSEEGRLFSQANGFVEFGPNDRA